MLLELKQASQQVLALPRYAKRVIALSVDVSLCILTVWFAFYLRLGEFVLLNENAFWAAGISIIISIPIFIVSGLYRAIFRYAGWPALFTVARAMGVYGLLYASIITAISIEGIPRTIGIIQPILLLFTVGGSRALARYWLGGLYKSQLQIAALPKALVYGAGNSGIQLVSALENSYEIRVVGFLDDDKRLHGHVINGQPIFAPNDLADLIETRNVTHVLLAIPSASRRRRNEILKIIGKHHVAVRTLPSFADLAEGRVTTSDIRDLDIDDLLGRESVAPNQILMAKNITSKIVLVTGAGGSIGSELCRQILMQKPSKLILLENSEFDLYSIHSELEAIIESDDGEKDDILISLLGSVQDEGRINDIFDTWKPNTVYHAAAYKHVPIVEQNISEGIKNNVIGTLVTAKAAIKYDTSDFVLISTDKAVRPTNIMGASKRLAELCLQSLYDNFSHTSKTRFSMVRFGNVLDSSGSVIPKFRKQIRDGGPITLTDPEVTRYFMTITEAAQLVIQAGAMAKGGDVFILDMGEPVKIADLAKRMVEMSGLTINNDINPDGDIEIKVIGLRPGEKLFEELLLGNNPQPTHHSKIMRAQDRFISWENLEKDLETLEILLAHDNIEVIISLLEELVVDYKSKPKITDWVYNEQIRI